jgi:beta-1,4-mannosyl-glycoprotein beta-1,4-N-acetylglucosaminyltransferase
VKASDLLVDCFLYSDQSPYRELLSLRLAVLGDVVDRFVVVASRQTFSGRVLASVFPEDDPVVQRFRDRIELVEVESLERVTPRRREEVTRNAICRGLHHLPDDALVMVSDIDELPRPEVLVSLLDGPTPRWRRVLALDYFNFKFNYRLVQGVQQAWAGPVIAPLSLLGVPQEARQSRWSLMHDPDRVVLNAGWHFSFLTETDDVRPKLDTMFVAGEVEWRGFRDGIRSDWQGSVSQLIEARRGFHDHMYAGSVWAHVNLGELRCEVVERAVLDFPGLLLPPPADLPEEVELRRTLAMWRMYDGEVPKILHHATFRQLASELAARGSMLARRTFRRISSRGLQG